MVARVNSRTPVMLRSELTAPNLKVSFSCDITIPGSFTYVLTIQEIMSSCYFWCIHCLSFISCDKTSYADL